MLRQEPWNLDKEEYANLEEPVKLCGTCFYRSRTTKRCSMNGMRVHYQQFACKMHSVGNAAILPAYKPEEINRYFEAKIAGGVQ